MKHDYPPTPLTRVRRRANRGHYDRATVHAILDAGYLCHVGYALDDQPVVTPTLYWREGDHVYWHGSSASRMLRRLEKGIKACLAVTHMDGLVLARSGFHHSVNYRSVAVFGTARPLARGDKARSLETFMARLFPGRWPELRPPTAQEIAGTTVLSMPIEQASAKIRTGPPIDDEGDYGWPVWAGVLPLAVKPGRPEPDPRLAQGMAAPAYLTRFK